jgi:hypothetical protein
VLIGEVSNVNDDLTDNIFREPIGRFSTVEEDAQIRFICLFPITTTGSAEPHFRGYFDDRVFLSALQFAQFPAAR